jgi:hypothetical protein
MKIHTIPQILQNRNVVDNSLNALNTFKLNKQRLN